MSMGNEDYLLDEQESKRKLSEYDFRKPLEMKTHPDGPRRSRRNKLLPSGKSMRGKTRSLRKKFRNDGNNRKVLVVAK